jgi:hypothetical protein
MMADDAKSAPQGALTPVAPLAVADNATPVAPSTPLAVPDTAKTTYQRDGEEHWLQTWWRPACAITYLIICLFDFVVMPVYTTIYNDKPEQLITAVMKLPDASQPTALTVLGTKTVWQSLTLTAGGLFHISFGAIIGVTAFGRTREKLAKLQTMIAETGDINNV